MVQEVCQVGKLLYLDFNATQAKLAFQPRCLSCLTRCALGILLILMKSGLNEAQSSMKGLRSSTVCVLGL